uniref:Pentatricopeptide repeat-containing protein-mitochondrial domain-containing protein n=1 Tax=Kwoniella dejecticola CBS 10117 TaxID=1296121 RepID=A0A1A6A2J5_9TREE|nr:uncharacterized protein I303_05130 [Kwoniella dejecticola CBS 10117]OBR84273.1 hypothetical protein I303_05130 [Kwoniella dejecticola CBS 10117]
MSTAAGTPRSGRVNVPNRRAPLPKLGRKAPNGESLSHLLNRLSQLRADSRRPRPEAYIAILQAAGDFSLSRTVQGDESDNLGWHVAQAAWEDAKAGQVDLGEEGMEALLRFTVMYPHLLQSFLLYTDSTIPGSYHALARAAASSGNLEHIIYLISSMFAKNIPPPLYIVKSAIRLACEWGCPRLALEIAEKVEKESATGVRVDQSAWTDILIASADSHFLSGVETAWNRVKNSYTPDEGLLLSMLNAAGRWGRPDFASTILEALPVSPQEQHLAPLLEAFCNAGEVPNAFHVLVSIREAGITPTMASVQPIVAVLSSVDLIDQAFYALEDMQNEGQPIDISALNALIDASSRLGDLQRARATQMAAADLGLIPNIDTFNLVLACCISARHRPLGDTILNEINGLSLPLNATTYQHMISLCLTQSKYEDAFYYLEKAKSDGFKPSYSTYDALVRKCVTAKDSRWRLVLDEMKILGYRPTNELHEFINNDGRSQPRGGKAHSSQKDEPRRAARVTRPASQVSYASRDRSGKATTPGPAA